MQEVPRSQRTIEEYVEIGQEIHVVQSSIHNHKAALAAIRKKAKREFLTEDDIYARHEHSEARRRLHSRNHMLCSGLETLAVITYLKSLQKSQSPSDHLEA